MMVYTYIMYVTFCLYLEGIKGMKGSNMSSFPHESSLKYQPPTQSQLEAAELWVASFSNSWRSLDPDSLREGMQPDTRNLIPPMSSPANQDGVVAHFREVLKLLPDLSLKVLRWAPVGDTVMIEWAASATYASKPLEWRGIDRVSLINGKTYESQAYWDTRKVAEMIAEASRA
jgi:predicted SnoaL-like aldol condensation-catalyzing enzyme